MLKESKSMGFDDDSDSSSSQPNLHFEFEDPTTLAKSKRLFHKTTTTDSISTLNTKEDVNMSENKSGRDEDSTITNNPSPTKKTRTLSTGPLQSDDISVLGDRSTATSQSRIEEVESALSTMQDMMNAFKSQNFTYTPTNLTTTMDIEMTDKDSDQDREPAQIVPETPGAPEAPGAIL